MLRGHRASNCRCISSQAQLTQEGLRHRASTYDIAKCMNINKKCGNGGAVELFVKKSQVKILSHI